MSRMLQIVRQARNITNVQKRSLTKSSTIFANKRQILTDEQYEKYKRDSFVVLDNLLSPDEKGKLQGWCSEIEKWAETSKECLAYHEKINVKEVITRLERYYDYHPEMRTLVDGKLSQAVADCLGEDVYVLKDKINFKYPGGMGYDAHQDETGFTMVNAVGDLGFHMTGLIAADRMTLSNGCLYIAPGNYKEGDGYLEQKHGYIVDEVADQLDWIPIECDIGTVVLFNSLVPHKSERNDTNQSRRAFYITWNGRSKGDMREFYFSLKRQMYPPDRERDSNADYSEGIKLFTEKEIEAGRNRKS